MFTRRHISYALSAASLAFSTAHAQSQPLSPAQFRPFTVRNVDKISHNTWRISLQLPHDQSLQLPVASCVVIRAPGIGEEGKDVIRPYTPVTTNRDFGHFDFVIKRYPQGKASVYTTNLQPGDKLEVKGPYMKLEYSPNWKKHVGMLAGGSGITPMFQIIKEALANEEDKTQYTLVYGNVTESDILLKEELDGLAAKHPNFKVHYVLQQAPEGWSGSVGYITADIIKSWIPAPSEENSIVLVCGSPSMMKSLSGDKKGPSDQGPLTGILKDLGYSEAQVFKF